MIPPFHTPGRGQMARANLKEMAEWTGLEPATPGVTGRYSNQLNYHSACWWVLRGSNPRPSPCKGDALPAELSTPLEEARKSTRAQTAWQLPPKIDAKYRRSRFQFCKKCRAEGLGYRCQRHDRGQCSARSESPAPDPTWAEYRATPRRIPRKANTQASPHHTD